MSCHLIDAESIRAWYHSFPKGGGLLTIEAQGHCECPQDARITRTPLPIEPPEFNLETCTCPAIGSFPYKATASFEMPYTKTVVVNTASGPKTVNVEPVPATQSLAVEEGDDEVTGYAPNSNNFQTAFAAAVEKLYKKYPGHIGAQVTKIGFVAVGSPIGIAFTYVTMKQQSS